MDKVRELDTFYRIAVAFGFTFMCMLILVVIGLLIIYVAHLVNYYKVEKAKKEKRIFNLDCRISCLEHKISEHDKIFAHFAKGTKVKKEKK